MRSRRAPDSRSPAADSSSTPFHSPAAEPPAPAHRSSKGQHFDRTVLLQGRLSAHPARQLLRGLASSGRSGTLVFARRDAVGAVVLRDGEVAYLVTEDPTRRLLVKLFERGALPQRQCARLAEQCFRSSLSKPLAVVLREQRGADLGSLRAALLEVAADQLAGLLELSEAHYRLEHQAELHAAAGAARRLGICQALAARARAELLRPAPASSGLAASYDPQHQLLDVREIAWTAARRQALFASLPGLDTSALFLLREGAVLRALASHGWSLPVGAELPVTPGSGLATALGTGRAATITAEPALLARLGVAAVHAVPVRCGNSIAGLLLVERGRRQLDLGAVEGAVREVSVAADRDLRSAWERRLDAVFARLRDFHFAFSSGPQERLAAQNELPPPGSPSLPDRPISFRLPF